MVLLPRNSLLNGADSYNSVRSVANAASPNESFLSPNLPATETNPEVGNKKSLSDWLSLPKIDQQEALNEGNRILSLNESYSDKTARYLKNYLAADVARKTRNSSSTLEYFGKTWTVKRNATESLKNFTARYKQAVLSRYDEFIKYVSDISSKIKSDPMVVEFSESLILEYALRLSGIVKTKRCFLTEITEVLEPEPSLDIYYNEEEEDGEGLVYHVVAGNEQVRFESVWNSFQKSNLTKACYVRLENFHFTSQDYPHLIKFLGIETLAEPLLFFHNCKFDLNGVELFNWQEEKFSNHSLVFEQCTMHPFMKHLWKIARSGLRKMTLFYAIEELQL